MLGIVAGLYDYDWKEAERSFHLAMASGPVPPQIHSSFSAFFLEAIGQREDSFAELERSLQGDPLSSIFR